MTGAMSSFTKTNSFFTSKLSRQNQHVGTLHVLSLNAIRHDL